MRAASYIPALDEWVCIDCVGAILDMILTTKVVEALKEQRTGDQAQPLRDALAKRGIV